MRQVHGDMEMIWRVQQSFEMDMQRVGDDARARSVFVRYGTFVPMTVTGEGRQSPRKLLCRGTVKIFDLDDDGQFPSETDLRMTVGRVGEDCVAAGAERPGPD